MFIQVISGKALDIDGIDRQMKHWDSDLRPAATGYLGTTAGVTDDGQFLASSRWESADAARRNSERPEQGEWWAGMEQYVSNVVFHDCSRVETVLGGGSDAATFVQVMQGRIKDRAKADKLVSRMVETEEMLRQARPDVIGQVTAMHDDGDTYTDVVYFRSEAEARANEANEMPAEAQEVMASYDEAFEVSEYLDLRRIWLR